MNTQTEIPEVKSSTIRWLTELDRASLAEAGGKGANLGEMTRAGLPVPPGFVVTASAYRSLLEASYLDELITARLEDLDYQDVTAVSEASQTISSWIKEAPMPPSIREEILQAYAALSAATAAGQADIPVAVRSSATAEDLPGASFAGQQETFLNICSAEAVLEAVQKAWAGLWTPQAISYRQSMGFEQLSVALAVVVQAMVPAEVAGVMFTANPVTRDRREILISASYGLGESVVSGSVTPDTFILAQDGTLRQQTLGSKETRISPNGCGTKVEVVPEEERRRYSLSSKDLSALAEMARRVQGHYGSPQDTEWAFSSGKLYLLQARPITTLGRDGAGAPAIGIERQEGAETLKPGEEPLVAPPPRGIENIIDHFPEPPLPLDVELIANNAFNLFFEKLGFRPPREPSATVERTDGRIALRLAQPGLSPAVLWKLPAHLLHILRTDPMADWRPLVVQITSWIEGMEKERRAAQDTIPLAQLITCSLKEFEPLFARRFMAAFFPGFVYSILVSRWVRMAVGKADAPEVENRLYRATPYPTARQNQAMANLASLEREVGRESSEYQSAFNSFLADWGNRPVRGMIAMPSSPTWAEQPEIVTEMVAALRSNPADPSISKTSKAEEQAYQEARNQVEDRLNPLFRRWFRNHLERARNALIVREEGLSLSEDYNAFLRRAVLQLGEMLAARGTLADPGDVFYLLLSELESAARGDLAEADARISRRKQGYQKLLEAQARGQHWLFATGSIPPLEKTQPETITEKQTLKGLGASQGVVTGPVRMIRGPEEFGKMRQGEILVAPFTAPAWTPLFRLASAVVTDIGSQASHAAIVAREYSIPCVVAASGATKTLRDGQMIRVDGSSGVITILA